MNSITDLLDLEDDDIIVTETNIQGNIKYVTLDVPPVPKYCPSCGFKMHSRGIKTRKISHPILQDGFHLILVLKQRRWRCTNPECGYETNDSFRFVNKNRRITNAADLLIVRAFRDLSASATSIATQFHTSDTHVLDVFDRFVHLDRLPLSDIISVDEVHLDLDEHCKYCLVIQDFHTGDPIDLLRSRRVNVTEPYFVNIPPDERANVKYLLSDMYNPYLKFVDKYFPNAVPVVDSFHVVQWVITAIDQFIRSQIKYYRERDRIRFREHNDDPDARPPLSDEVYILQRYRWLVLSNKSNITYHEDVRMDAHYRVLMNTYDYERELFRIQPRLQRLRDLKEDYMLFNDRNEGKPLLASKELDDLIKHYMESGDSIFRDFSKLLEKFHDPIVNSFIMVEKNGNGKLYNSRLSNGPIESLNRKAKDLKRLGRGYRNFEHFRNRFLYATRDNPILNGIEGSKQVQYFDDSDD